MILNKEQPKIVMVIDTQGKPIPGVRPVLIKPAALVLPPIHDACAIPFSALVGPMNAWKDQCGTRN
jgi:hypothetical protein